MLCLSGTQYGMIDFQRNAHLKRNDHFHWIVDGFVYVVCRSGSIFFLLIFICICVIDIYINDIRSTSENMTNDHYRMTPASIRISFRHQILHHSTCTVKISSASVSLSRRRCLDLAVSPISESRSVVFGLSSTKLIRILNRANLSGSFLNKKNRKLM